MSKSNIKLVKQPSNNGKFSAYPKSVSTVNKVVETNSPIKQANENLNTHILQKDKVDTPLNVSEHLEE